MLLTGYEADFLVLHHGNSAGFLRHTANAPPEPQYRAGGFMYQQRQGQPQPEG